ncbi:hypothetical protein D0T85_14780 [Bacteroides sp. 519]|nr:hypothetical protein [Bacteroides sp. 519]
MQHFINAKCSILKLQYKIGLTTLVTGGKVENFPFMLFYAHIKLLNKQTGTGKIFYYHILSNLKKRNISFVNLRIKNLFVYLQTN